MWSFGSFVLSRGEFWSVKFIETKGFKKHGKTEHGPKTDQSKQKIEMKSAIGLCTILLIYIFVNYHTFLIPVLLFSTA